MIKFLHRILFLLLFAFTLNGFAQSAANYAVTRNTGISYTTISGTGSSFSGWRNGTAVFGNRSNSTSIGFDFWYLGVKYTNFSVSTSGYVDFSSSAANGDGIDDYGYDYSNFYNNTLLTGLGLAPFYNYVFRCGTNLSTNIKYLVTGSAPNRILTVEWIDMEGYNGGFIAASSFNFQVKIYETTGVIEFIYGIQTLSTASLIYVCGINAAAQTATATASELKIQQTANTSTFNNTETSLTTVPANNSQITLTPPQTPIAPSTLTFSSVSQTAITLNWIDNSTNECSFLIQYSTDGITYSDYATVVSSTSAGTGGSKNYTASGLTCGTTFYWKVYALTEGYLSNEVSGTQATNSIPAPGTYSIGPSADNYTTIALALADLACTQITGSYIFELQSDYNSSVETYPLTLTNVVGTNSFNTITIRPATGATGRSITSNNVAGTIVLDEAKYIIFDGRPGGSGSNDLTISNTSTSGEAIIFQDDASNNTFKYCNITGVNTSTTSGAVVFSTTTESTGNDYNTLEYCNISKGASALTNCIYATGTASSENNNNTISNCNIYDFYLSTANHCGILISSNNTDWNITGNSFYQTTANYTGVAYTCYPIYINNTSGVNFSITNNFIGGNTSNASGTWSVTTASAAAYKFDGIYLNAGTDVASSIQGNTIKNITWNTSSTSSTGAGVFCGIDIVAGKVNIGTTSANTIGATSGTGSISVRNTVTGSSTNLINTSSTSTVNISNNNVGAITTTSSGVSISHGIIGINISGASGNITVSANNIGSSATANSINASVASTSATAQVVDAIKSSNGGTIVISNNNIYNINNEYTYANTVNVLTGIETSGGKNTISTNVIYNLSTPNTGTGTYDNGTVIGISQLSTSASVQLIDHNTIYNLSNSCSSAAIEVSGIYFTGPTSVTNVISHNKIFSLSTTSTNTSVSVSGICYDGGVSNYHNNFIRLGVDASGNSQTTAFAIKGIRQRSTATNTNNVYYNSVFIGGTGVSTASTSESYCFARYSSSGTLNVKNNSFYNSRSNSGGGGGTHYAIAVASTTSLTSNYNNLYIDGTGGKIGNSGTGSFADWKSGTGQDANSVNVNPGYKLPNGTSTTMDLHIDPTNCNLADKGTPIAGLTSDIDDETRSGVTPDIGADEFGGSISTASAAAACSNSNTTLTITNYETGTLQWQTSTTNSPYAWSDVGGATNANYTTSNLTATTYFRCKITHGGCVKYTNEIPVYISPTAPSNPGAITGNTIVCLNSSNTYSITAVTGTYLNYVWSVPSGATITSGQGTNTITVTMGSTSGNVSVYVSNPCGTTTTSTLAVTTGGNGMWTGKTDTKWHTGSNWCGEGIPTSTTDVVIYPTNASTILNQPTINRYSGDAVCRDLNVASGATLTISPYFKWAGQSHNTDFSGILIVYGNLTHNGTIIQNKFTDNITTVPPVFLVGSGKTISGTTGVFSSDYYTASTGYGFLDITSTGSYTLNCNLPIQSNSKLAGLVVTSSASINLNGNTLTTDWYYQTGNFNSGINGTLEIKGSTGRDIWGTYNTYTSANTTWQSGSLYKLNVANTNLTSGSSDMQYAETSSDRFNNVEFLPTAGYTYTRGAHLYANGYIKISSGTFNGGAAYTSKLKGDWINNATFTGNTSTIEFDGSSLQKIDGTSATTFYNLKINNSNTTTLNGVRQVMAATVSNQLNMSSGELDLNATTLTITNAAGSGTTRSGGYALSEDGTDDGNNLSKIQWNIGTNTDAHIYPFGYPNGTANGDYLPVTFDPTGAGSYGNITVATRTSAVNNLPYAAISNVAACNDSAAQSGGGFANSVIDRWWDISSSLNPGPSGTTTIPAITLSLTYRGAENTMTLAADRTTELAIQHWQNTYWNDGKGGGAGTYSATGTNGVTTGVSTVTASGFTQFSPYILSKTTKALPVTLSSFKGDCLNDVNLIYWETLSEKNNEGFYVEKSSNGKDFYPLSFITGNGIKNSTSKYSYYDKKTSDIDYYYRLKQFDFDGHYEYSEVIKVKSCTLDNKSVFEVYPVPADNEIYINASLISGDNSIIEIYDATGRMLKFIEQSESKFNIKIDISDLPKGTYLIKLSSVSENFNTKIIK